MVKMTNKAKKMKFEANVKDSMWSKQHLLDFEGKNGRVILEDRENDVRNFSQ